MNNQTERLDKRMERVLAAIEREEKDIAWLKLQVKKCAKLIEQIASEEEKQWSRSGK